MFSTYRLLAQGTSRKVCCPLFSVQQRQVASSASRSYSSQTNVPLKSHHGAGGDDVTGSAKRLARLKWALENKRLQLQVLESLENNSNSSKRLQNAAAAAASAPSTVSKSLDNERYVERPTDSMTTSTTTRSFQQKPPHSQPADMHVRLPKIERDFPQPMDAEIAKVAIIGSPNAGKSTLVNELVQSTVSIVSARPHSTREQIRAVLTKGSKQIVFFDTPGVVTEKNEHRLNRELVTSSWKAISGAHHLIVVVDSKKLLDHTTAAEDHLFERLSKLEYKVPATLVLSKMDLVQGREAEVEQAAAKYSGSYPYFEKVVYTCVGSNERFGIRELEAHLLTKTQPGQWMFPAKQKTDLADLQRVEDCIRAEVFEVLKVPYNVKQRNAGWTELEDGTLRIDQDLLVERPGLKKILVGTGGKVIRDVTLKAREKIGRALQRRILLILQVKVHNRLRTDPTLKQ